jgi:protein tyrosine kinase modulator
MDTATMVTTYLRIAWKRKWWVFVPLVLCTAAATAVLQRMPEVYRASTLILFQPQDIPSDYVKPTVTSALEGGLKTIRQQVTSRTRLEQAARDLELFPPTDDPRVTEERISWMRGKIGISVKEETSFTLSYKSQDPELAARAANRLAELFIEASAMQRQLMARGTSDFLGAGLARKKKELAERERVIAEFKRQHQDELPEQQQANLRTVDSLKQELRENQRAQERARDRKALLEAQLSRQPERSSTGELDPTDPRSEVKRLKLELREFRKRYTDEYPDVKRLTARIESLEEMIRSLPEESGGEEEKGLDPVEDRLLMEIGTAEAQMKRLATEEFRLREELLAYEQRLERMPQREQELLSLQRDYTTLRDSYQSLLDKKEDAELAETLEEERRGAQFVVLDRAVTPAIPFSPDPVQVIGAGVLLGLSIGVGLIVLLEVFQATFYGAQEVQEVLGVPVVAAIPRIPQAEGRWFHRSKASLWFVAAIGLATTGLIGF